MLRGQEILKSERELKNEVAYLVKRAQDPSYTFRDHLREVGGAVEEYLGEQAAADSE